MIYKILDIKSLLELYKKGFFPMGENSHSENITFYKPEKRFIIPIKSFHIPKRLFKEFKKKKFELSINSNFTSVIKNCAKPRKNEGQTWINKIISNTYIQLFKEGYAKSIECYYEKKLVGGLYGIHIGGCFFGESMFSIMNNSSKHCLLFLISILQKNNFILLDSQFHNPHLLQFGAKEINNKEYQKVLKKGIYESCIFPETFNIDKSIYILQLLSHKS